MNVRMTHFYKFSRKVIEEQGSMLLNLLIFLVFLGLLSASIVTVVTSEAQLLLVSASERQAFYAAQAGLEYGTKRILSDLGFFTYNWSEDVNTGAGSHCLVQVTYPPGIASDSVIIRATGYSDNFAKILEKRIQYINIADYAIYAGGTVSNVYTSTGLSFHNSSLIYQNASVMPRFDLDELRDIAKPTHYYPGDLTISTYFYFNPQRLAFIEGNLYLRSYFSLGNQGDFVSMGKIEMRTFATIDIFYPTVYYQPTSGQNFTKLTVLGPFSGWVTMRGGMISNGNVSDQGSFLSLFWVFYNRVWIENFMARSLNGGPILMLGSEWRNIN